MADEHGGCPWDALWRCLAALQEDARRLRRLSQEEPLLQARPDYPRARIGRSHAAELREVLDDIVRRLEDAERLVPQALPNGQTAAGLAAEEAPPTVAGRLAALAKVAASLRDEAFQPLPPLPQHAPPYLAETPRRDLAGSKAVLLSLGLEDAAAALRNALLAAVNTGGASQTGGELKTGSGTRPA